MQYFDFSQVIWLGIIFVVLYSFMNFWFIPRIEIILKQRQDYMSASQNEVEKLNQEISKLSQIYEEKINDSIQIIKQFNNSTLSKGKAELQSKYFQQVNEIEENYQNSRQALEIEFIKKQKILLIHIKSLGDLLVEQFTKL